MIQQLQQAAQTLKTKEAEIKKLKELCTKNKIEIPVEQPPREIVKSQMTENQPPKEPTTKTSK